jgi:alanine-glyoxylate transaminase/serine-glyoxylate transaminase/serine-pyruvate transaminase
MDRTVTATPRLLVGPGPANVDPRVLQALHAPVQGHLDPELLATLKEIQKQLREVFRTANVTTLAVSGTGSAGMECCLVNVVSPGEKVLVGVGGYFGQRLAQVSRRLGAEVVEVPYEAGQALDPQRMIEALRCHPDARVVAVVHAETSTGVLQPVAEIGEAVAQTEALFLVDCVTSLGGVPVEVDAWHIDLAYSCTQKCLGMISGLSPVTFSAKAMEVVRRRVRPPASFYLGIDVLTDYWNEPHTYHHTACSNLYYGLKAALDLLFEEGLARRWERHAAAGRLLQERLLSLGCRLFAADGARLPVLTTVLPAPGVDAAAVRRALLHEYGIEVGAGLGEWRDKMWRIGLMGYNARRAVVDVVCGALEELLQRGSSR